MEPTTTIAKISRLKLKDANVSGFVYCLWNSQIFFLAKFCNKNGLYGTIYIFKNYFTIIFSIFSNKWYLNRPLSSFTLVSVKKFVYFIIIIYLFLFYTTIFKNILHQNIYFILHFIKYFFPKLYLFLPQPTVLFIYLKIILL